MLFPSSRGGLSALLIIGAIVYFSGAWPWITNKLKGLDTTCYSALADIGGSMTQPICGALANGLSFMDRMGGMAHERIARLGDSLGLSNSVGVLQEYTQKVASQAAGLRSSQDALAQLIARGPNLSGAGSLNQQLQQAVDSFAIGQSYLVDAKSPQQALPWLQAGASMPQGFGLLSQLSLAQAYASGSQGIPKDTGSAQTYLKQANGSIEMLMGNNSPQAQQILKMLPVPPGELQNQIQRAIKQMQLDVK